MREKKYKFLNENTLSSVDFQKINYTEPFYFFVHKDTDGEVEYKTGFGIQEISKIYSAGIVTANDNILVDNNKNGLIKKISEHYGIADDTYCQKLAYRPFDMQYVYYDVSKLERPREKIMRQFVMHENYGLVIAKQCASEWRYAFITETIANLNLTGTAGRLGSGFVFPLYLYPEEGSIETERRANLDEKIWAQINTTIGKEASPEDIFDYIYGVLHSPAYRAKYKEFLKVDFPRIPYPKNADEFEHFRSFGYQLRELHLMHNVPESPVSFPNAGTMQVDYLRWEWNKDDGYSGNIWINETQCFEGVPTEAWEFYIGGYQPAQKWLKDRKGRTLSFDDIEHYRKIISVLIETKAIMEKIG